MPLFHKSTPRCFLTVQFVLFSFTLAAQSFYAFPSYGTGSFRGLSAVSDNIVWVSGSAGTVGRSLNGGRFFQWIKVPGYAKTEFRDIHAFSDKEVVIMGITDPAVILKSNDAGKTWRKVFEDKNKKAFFDAIDFRGDSGILIGDPVDRRPVVLRTSDRGDHWIAASVPPVLTDSSEAFFAASGANILLKSGGGYLCVSGGTRSFVYSGEGWKDSLALNQGEKTTGANAIAADPSDSNRFYIVGGDFDKDSLSHGNAIILYTNPLHTELPAGPPSGYKSSVCYVDGQRLVACGTSGVDISSDGGMHWQKISSKSFHVCAKSRAGNKVFLAGGKGAFAVIDFP